MAFGSEVPCTDPVRGWWPESDRADRAIRPYEVKHARPLWLDCGRCESCRLKKAREWSARCVAEAALHTSNSFLTLTYADSNLPADLGQGHTLYPSHLTDFWKRLRRRSGVRLRYLACGEYGDRSGRPHYHAIVFGWRPPDLVDYQRTLSGMLYTSKFLDGVWSLGHVVVGDVTSQSSAYVAKYTLKKVYGYEAEETYKFRIPPFLRASNRPGIGAAVPISEFVSDDRVAVAPGVLVPTPRYLLKVLKRTHPKVYDEIMQRRASSAYDRKQRPQPSLASEAAVVAAKLKLSQREFQS